MNKLLIPVLLALSGAPLGANAATLDITTFTLATGINSPSVVTPTLATLLGSSSVTAQVNGLSSFEWKFTAGDIYAQIINDYSYLTTSVGTVQLSDIQTVGSFGTSGWINYVFATPYSGSITVGVQNALDDETASELQLRNFMTAPPVPEPETYAMLLTGMGLIGAVARRRRQRFATI